LDKKFRLVKIVVRGWYGDGAYKNARFVICVGYSEDDVRQLVVAPSWEDAEAFLDPKKIELLGSADDLLSKVRGAMYVSHQAGLIHRTHNVFESQSDLSFYTHIFFGPTSSYLAPPDTALNYETPL